MEVNRLITICYATPSQLKPPIPSQVGVMSAQADNTNVLALNVLAQQSGFVAGRSTMDAILALRLLAEIHREFDRPLHVAFLDIKAAFDSVGRQVWRTGHIPADWKDGILVTLYKAKAP